MAHINHTIKKPLNGTTMVLEIYPVYTREFFVRRWLGIRLLRLAAWVLGCDIRFEGDA